MADNINIKINVDSDRSNKRLADFLRDLNKLDKNSANVRQTFKALDQSVADALRSAMVGFKGVDKTISELDATTIRTLKSAVNGFNSLQTTINKVNGEMRKMKDSMAFAVGPDVVAHYKKAAKGAYDFSAALEKNKANLFGLKGAIKAAGSELDRLNAKMSKSKSPDVVQDYKTSAKQVYDKEKKALAELTKEREKANASRKSATKAAEAAIATMNRSTESIKRSTGAVGLQGKALDLYNIKVKRAADMAKLRALAEKHGANITREQVAAIASSIRANHSAAMAHMKVKNASAAHKTAVEKLGGAYGRYKKEMREYFSLQTMADRAAQSTVNVLRRIAFGLKSFSDTLIDSSSQFLSFRNSLLAATDSMDSANIRLGSAIQIAKDLKLPIVAITKEYAKFINASTLAGLSIDTATKYFKSFAGAARVLNMTGARTSQMFLALEQMISKGFVSMEELRRQLGQHLPGAFEMAAQAMGYTHDQLSDFHKLVSSGQLRSSDFIPKFAALIEERYGHLVPQALKKASAAVQGFNNAWTSFVTMLGLSTQDIFTGLYTGLENVVNWFNELLFGTTEVDKFLRSMDDTVQKTSISLNSLVQATDSTVNSVVALKTEAIPLVAVLGTLTTGAILKSLQGIGAALLWLISPIKAIVMWFARAAAASAFIALLTAPITAVVAGVAALAAGVYYLWDAFSDGEDVVKQSAIDIGEFAFEVDGAALALEGYADRLQNIMAIGDPTTMAREALTLRAEAFGQQLKVMLQDYEAEVKGMATGQEGLIIREGGQQKILDDISKQVIGIAKVMDTLKPPEFVNEAAGEVYAEAAEKYKKLLGQGQGDKNNLVKWTEWLNKKGLPETSDIYKAIIKQAVRLDNIKLSKERDKQIERDKKAIDKAADSVDRYILSLDKEKDAVIRATGAIGLKGKELKLYNLETDVALKTSKFYAMAEADSTGEIMKKEQAVLAAIEGYRQMKVEQIELTKITEKLTGQIKDQEQLLLSIDRALTNYADTVGFTFENVESVVQNTFKGMEDVLVEFITTGKASFRDLVDSILADITRLVVQQSITAPIATAVTGSLSGGGFGGWLGQIFGSMAGTAGGTAAAAPMISGGSASMLSQWGVAGLATGTNYVPHDGLAYLHKGEAVVPEKYNKYESSGGETYNVVVNIKEIPPGANRDSYRLSARQGALEGMRFLQKNRGIQ